jgi:carbohydrate diacid regulator
MATPQQLKDFARRITIRVFDLLQADVRVVDESGAVLATTTDWLPVPPAEAKAEARKVEYLRVPFSFDDLRGEVVVAQPVSGGTASTKVAKSLVELMLNQTVTAGQLETQQGQRNRFVYNLLNAQDEDAEKVVRQGEMLGLDLARPRVVLLVEPHERAGDEGESYRPSAAARSSKLAQRLFEVVSRFLGSEDDICAHIGGSEVVVLKASRTQALMHREENNGATEPGEISQEWVDLGKMKHVGHILVRRVEEEVHLPVDVGVGRYYEGVSGLALSYRDARTALILGRRHNSEHGVYGVDDLGIMAFVGATDEALKKELAGHLLRPLEGEAELLETLRIFFLEDCSASTTAKRLHIHRNTLAYRLEKIALLTRLDPRRFDNAMQLRLAMLLRPDLVGPRYDRPEK